jgi:hypothetical protein
MLTHDELVDLYRSLREERVLSVYMDGKVADFAERKAWRRRLEHQLAEARGRLDGSDPEDTAAFGRALGRIEASLDAFDNFLPDRGWVGFATSDGLVHAGPLRVPMPDLVRWETGIRVAPYVRALKQERPVYGVILDSRRARLFDYRAGELREPENLSADTFLGDLTDMNVSKRPTAHSGVRGVTGTDAAQAYLEVGSERMLKRLAERLTEAAGSRGHVVLGGTQEAVSHMAGHLPPALRGRVIERPALRFEMSEAEAKEEMETAASELNQAVQERLLTEVMDQARSGGRGALGLKPVEQALSERRVDTLFLSRGFIRANPDFADHLVGAAFEQHAEVEELSTDAASRLDAEGEGVAARLRYTL